MDVDVFNKYLYNDIISIIENYLGNKVVVYNYKDGTQEIRDHIPSPYMQGKIKRRKIKDYVNYLIYLDDLDSKYRTQYNRNTMQYKRRLMYGNCPGMPWNPGVIHSEKKCLILLNENMLSFKNYITLHSDKIIKKNTGMHEFIGTGRFIACNIYTVKNYSSPKEIIDFVKKYKPKQYTIIYVPDTLDIYHDDINSYTYINEKKYYFTEIGW